MKQTYPRASTVLPSGEVVADATATTPAAPPPSQNDSIRVDSTGRIIGIDGMLDQIAGALMKQAGPMIARDILPVIQRDRETQKTVGAAAGAALADKLRPWVIVASVSLGVLAGVKIVQLVRN